MSGTRRADPRHRELLAGLTGTWRVVIDQVRDPRDGRRRKDTVWSRHFAGRRVAAVLLFFLLLGALLLPLLLLTPATPGSPAHYANDPAVQALWDYQHGLDGSPAAQQAAAAAATSLTFVTLPNGTLKVSRVGRAGQCFYLLIPAATDANPTGVRPGTPADCQ